MSLKWWRRALNKSPQGLAVAKEIFLNSLTCNVFLFPDSESFNSSRMNSKIRHGDTHFSAETSFPSWDKFLYCKCRNLIGGSSIAQAVNLCKLRCEKYCFRLIHFCPSLYLQVLFDECERMLHWFSYWFWWHFSVVSRFPWGEGRWTFFDIWFYFSVPLAEGRGCFLFFFFSLSFSLLFFFP